jgi:hypothetical protein
MLLYTKPDVVPRCLIVTFSGIITETTEFVFGANRNLCVLELLNVKKLAYPFLLAL